MTAFGLMLHHFKGGVHPDGQGAITAEQFASMIDYLGPKNFLHPEEWIERSKSGRLRETDRCITFDDSLLCQYEIAKPVLDHYAIKAFWFVYSSVFEGNVERLELYRHYRSVQFADVNVFYGRFFAAVLESEHGDAFSRLQGTFDTSSYLSQFTFYSADDRKFRYVRDHLLGPRSYFSIMDDIIASDRTYSVERAIKDLWMQNAHLKDLVDTGHIVGLHSYSHPTDIKSMTRSEQTVEYVKNYSHLKEVTGSTPRAMSHPCGSYNEDTLSILRNLGVEIGFVASLKGGRGSLLEQPRDDHSHVAMEMGMR